MVLPADLSWRCIDCVLAVKMEMRERYRWWHIYVCSGLRYPVVR